MFRKTFRPGKTFLRVRRGSGLRRYRGKWSGDGRHGVNGVCTDKLHLGASGSTGGIGHITDTGDILRRYCTS